MICELCGNLSEECECDSEDVNTDIDIDFGDDEGIYGYDGDCL